MNDVTMFLWVIGVLYTLGHVVGIVSILNDKHKAGCLVHLIFYVIAVAFCLVAWPLALGFIHYMGE